MGCKALIRCLIVAALVALLVPYVFTAGAEGKTAPSDRPSRINIAAHAAVPDSLNLSDFGAVGDGVTDDGPALQSALDALAAAGGGTLFVPEGRYAIATPVSKDFTNLASSVTIQGVETSIPIPPPNASAGDLTRGLDLTSGFVPRTGEQQVAISITGLQSLLIKDILFIGTPDVATDAVVTLALHDVESATVRHCEFYGLSTRAGGAILHAAWSGLTVEQTAFLGSTANSGLYSPVVQNIDWKSITFADTVFVDYGKRPELFGKTGLGSPFSWVNIGNAATVTPDSPRREAVFRNVFLDEGGFFGLTGTPNYFQTPSAPIDLVYVTNLHMNVSNLGASGHFFDGLQRVMVENSHYGWSTNTDSGISILGAGNAILDRVVTEDSATRIRADADTQRLTVINSVYEDLASEAQSTSVIDTENDEDDPVWYVRQQFLLVLGRDPDPAAHFYWADQILQCGGNTQCVADRRAELSTFLEASPAPKISIAGSVIDDNAAEMQGVTITLSGSQSVATETDSNGQYHFTGLPTSGVYTITASKRHYTFASPEQTFIHPTSDQDVGFTATLNRHGVVGRLSNSSGNGLTGATVTLSGAVDATVTTDAGGNYSFSDLPAGEAYTLTPSKANYTFNASSYSIDELDSDRSVNFTGTLNTYTISGRVTLNGAGMGGVSITLSGSQSAQAATNADGSYSFPVLAEGNYDVRPSKTNYTFAPALASFNVLSGNQVADFAATQRTLEFAAAILNAAENVDALQIDVVRAGDTSNVATIRYSATDGTAHQGEDVSTVIGQLTFAPGETSRSFTIFITDDAFVENTEQLTVTLSNPSGAALGSRTSSILTISDNDSAGTNINPIDGPQFFVRQHYQDFLHRNPDAAGLDFWSNQIVACGNNTDCLIHARQNVSAAFFLSIEFQETGYLAYRMYKAAYGRMPRRVDEFLFDARLISEDVLVGNPGWDLKLEANKAQFIAQFVVRPEFVERYPIALTPAQFVGNLNTNTGLSLSAGELTAAIAEFNGAANSADTTARYRAIRRVVENSTFVQRETSPAFVLMQYFGYLQRNPDEAPDSNLDGFNFWLAKLNQFGGDYGRAEMVRAFLESIEYRTRFGN
ncbi:MAG: carboxypeptidase regulatory-like domain-containing protein [Pyrinomonadaceae bacterium]